MDIKFFGGDEAHGDVFVVETRADAGYTLGNHAHSHAHTSVLVHGIADVTIGDETHRYHGYNIIVVPAGIKHEVTAVTDIIWLCLWASDKAPREEAEESLKLLPPQ